jgi:TetR/AcrR family transcriptional regulator, transcriptional repressor for nem operon
VPENELTMTKGDETRERIIAKAADLFNQRGLEGTSMSDLMEATGLEKGGIYRHFASKEAVAAEAFDYAWEEAFQERVRDLGSISGSVDRLKHLIANFVERRSSIPGGCPLLNTAVDSDDGNPVLRERARQALGKWQNLLTSIINDGIQRREIRRGVDPNRLAMLIISSLEGALMISRLERNRDALVAARSHLDSYLEKEIRARSPRSRSSTLHERTNHQ